MKLGDKITVNQKYVRVYSRQYDTDYRAKYHWKLIKIKPVEGYICGIRNFWNGTTDEGCFMFSESPIKAYKVAINMKSIINVPI